MAVRPDSKPVDDRLVVVDEAAAMMRVKPKTIHAWAYARRIRVVEPLGRLLRLR